MFRVVAMATKRHNRAREVLRRNFCALSALLGALQGFAQAEDLAFVEALRARQLTRLAEVWCQQQIQQADPGARRSAELVCLLSEIETDRALSARAGESAAHWQAADATLANFVQQQPGHPALILVRLQQALNTGLQGEVQQLRAASRGAGSGQSIRTLRLAAKRLDAVATQIEQLRQVANRPEKSFSDRELTSLANRVALKLAECNLTIARSYPNQSADRDDALLSAAKMAGDLAARSLPDALLWQARLALVETLRMLGKPDEAAARLASWRGEAVPPELVARRAAEQWRLLQQTAGDAQAKQFIAVATPAVRNSPELLLAILEDAVRRWRVATGGEKQQLAAAIGEQVARLRSRHGGMWSLRAEALSSDMLAEPVADGSIESLATSAERLYRLGRTAQAIDAYDRAAAVAYQAGARGRAFELALAAAAIKQSQQKWSEAASRYRRAALASSTHADAAVAHRTAVVCRSQAIRQSTDADAAEAWQAYFALLDEHLATWPNTPSATELRWWLIDALTARREWLRVAKVLAQTPATDARHGESQTRLANAWTRRLSQVSAERDEAKTKANLASAVDQLQPLIITADRRWPATWTASQRHVALALARLRLTRGRELSDAQYADQLLRAAIKGDPKPAEHWLTTANALLAAGQVRLENWEAAGKTIRQSPPIERGQALPLLEALRAAMNDTPERRQLAGELTLSVLEGMPKANGGAGADWQLPYRTAALEAIGQGADALANARRLVEQKPGSAAAQVQLARLLAESADQANRREALALWQAIENRSGRGERRWLDARLARIRLLAVLGKRDQALKLLKLTRVLQPNLGGRQREFDAVEAAIAN